MTQIPTLELNLGEPPPKEWFTQDAPKTAFVSGLEWFVDSLENPPLDLEKYQTDLIGYARDILKMSFWAGENGGDGQLEIAQALQHSAKRQLEGDDSAIRVFRVGAGHGVGKTALAGAVVNWFFDCFKPSITITTAPSDEQVRLLLWKEIKTQRAESPYAKSLTGKVAASDPAMKKAANHFAIGRTTSDSGGQGTARFQGQHGKYLLFIVDEAEGVPEFVFDAINAMMTGGTVALCLMLANPMTRTSRFHRESYRSDIKNFNLDVLNSTNVVHGKEIVPGLTSRRWVLGMIGSHCQPVPEADPDKFTFSVGFDIETADGRKFKAGTIWQPDAEFLFRVRGVAPLDLSSNTFITTGRYQAAVKRPPRDTQPTWARVGVDAARFGTDSGTIYGLTVQKLERIAKITSDETDQARRTRAYFGHVKRWAENLPASVTSLHVRVDASGGFGAGLADLLLEDTWFKMRFFDWRVIEVSFGENAYDNDKYKYKVTELYATAAETLLTVSLPNPPPELEIELTSRTYEWTQSSGVAKRVLTEKEVVRRILGRSPDDGDGAVLALAPDYIFPEPQKAQSSFSLSM